MLPVLPALESPLPRSVAISMPVASCYNVQAIDIFLFSDELHFIAYFRSHVLKYLGHLRRMRVNVFIRVLLQVSSIQCAENLRY